MKKSSTEIRRGTIKYDTCCCCTTYEEAMRKVNKIRAAGIAAFPHEMINTWHVYAELGLIQQAREIAGRAG